jgi:LEA14-like dessication related protein
MQILINWFLPLIVLISLQSCTIKEVQFKELKDVKIIKASKDLIEVEVLAVIYNPNWFGFRVKDNDLDLFMNNNRVGKARLVRGFRVEGNSEKTYRFKVKAIPENSYILGNALSMLTGLVTRKQSFGIKGDLKVSVLGIGTTYRVDLTHYLN